MLGHFTFKMNSFKGKCFLLTFILSTLYTLVSFVFLEKSVIDRPMPVKKSSIALRNVVVHIDLKSAPPRLRYLTFLLPLFKKLGVTGLLMEYEDMFPYMGPLIKASAKNAYKKKKLKKFIKQAAKSGIDVIPLIQTFTHMDSMLKLKTYEYLREERDFPDTICPSNKDSILLINEIFMNIIKIYTKDNIPRYVHIGCSDVTRINKCQQCINTKQNDLKLFLNYTKRVMRVIKSVSANTTILIWEDKMRDLDPEFSTYDKDLIDFQPVIKHYEPNLDNIMKINLIHFNHQFSKVWIASAFKGADGNSSTIPDLRSRMYNHLYWMQLIYNYRRSNQLFYDFEGIILTGKSRYNHFDPICDLLPVSIPSLVVNLLLMKKFHDYDFDKSSTDVDDLFKKHLAKNVAEVLKCKKGSVLSINDIDGTNCSFEGAQLYNFQKQFSVFDEMVRIKLEQYDNNNNKLELNDVQWLNKTLQDFDVINEKISKELTKYYDAIVVDEYLATRTYGLKLKLMKMYKMIEPLTVKS